MYDRLTARTEPHSQLEDDEIQRMAPGLTTDGLDRALSYTDAMADDARLTLAVAATAHAYGAQILTRCDATGTTSSDRRPSTSIILRDLEGDRTLRASARVVVNATGVWTDEVRAHLRWGGVIHLEDLLLRRVRLGMWQPDLSMAMLRRLRSVVRTELGWDSGRWRREEEAYVEALEPWTMDGIRG
jgi:glycerol-3-phosphate dehydrogenase